MTQATILVPLAIGFEEIEACSIIDTLRRANNKVIVAGIGGLNITGAHDISIQASLLIEDVDETSLTAIVLPGGMPGTTNLLNSTPLKEILLSMNKQKKLICAVCAAPLVLESHGLLKGKNATSYPNVKDKLTSCNYSEENVVVDGNIITSRGVGTAMEFSLEIVKQLNGLDVSETLAKQMLIV